MGMEVNNNGVAAQIANGKIVSGKTETNENGTVKKEKSGNASMDKNAFLGLLVAQMKYQDPLEPQSNTEYVSQFATFSELEEMQNMSTSMDTQRASSLVGQYVTVKVSDTATGQTTLEGGKVDYVAIEGGKAFLNINGKNYSIDDLDSIVDEAYLTAYNLSTEFNNSLKQLPPLSELTLSYKEVIDNLNKVYDDMTSYQKSFISKEQKESLDAYTKKLNELVN